MDTQNPVAAHNTDHVAAQFKETWHAPTLTRIDIKQTLASYGPGSDASSSATTPA